MPELPTPVRHAFAVLADAARELTHGLARAIGDTADIIADALDSRPEPEPARTPFAGLLAAMQGYRGDDTEPATDRAWVMTRARDLKPGDDVRFNTGAEYHVVEVTDATDYDGDAAVSLHLTDRRGRAQVAQLVADAPLLACPATPDDASALAP